LRKALTAVLILVLAAAASPGQGQPKTADPLERLARLYEDSRYFELRDAVAQMEDHPSPEMEFYRGAVDEVFNRLDSAVSRLQNYLRSAGKGPAPMMAKEAWVLLADAFRRAGRYREAGEARREILDRFRPVLSQEERTNCENQVGLWSALADIPPQEVEVGEGTTIRMTNRQFPVRVKDRTFFVGYDTGANLSVLYKSIADELGVAIYGPAIKIQSGTGRWIDGRTGVVPEMRLGSIIIRNAVFLVLPDELFPSAVARFGVDRRGLLGAPILEGFKEIAETKDGDLIIPASPRPRSEQNMVFSGFMPVVEVLFRGARLSLSLDTGSSATHLYPPFFRRYRGEIASRSPLRKSTMGSVGSSVTVPIHVLDEFGFRAGGKALSLRKIAVQTEVTHSDTRYLHGTLGLDILAQCSRMTLNFESMSFILE
jgi:hypothetical protein